MTLTAQQLLEDDALETLVVPVPEWARGKEHDVVIRVMDGAAMSLYQCRMEAATEAVEPAGKDANPTALAEAAALRQHAIRRRIMVEYCAACIVDPVTLELVYDTPAKIGKLARKNGEGLQRIFTAARQLHRDTAEAAEAFEKNSDATIGSGSGGSTPTTKDSPTPTESSEN